MAGLIARDEVITKAQDPISIQAKLQEMELASAVGMGPEDEDEEAEEEEPEG